MDIYSKNQIKIIMDEKNNMTLQTLIISMNKTNDTH